MGAKIERKYLAHFIDKDFNVDPDATSVTPDWYRLGQDLEAFAEELNPQTEVKKNILGEQSVNHQGYQVQSTVDTFYAYEGDELFEQLAMIANTRATGDQCVTSRVECLFHLSTETATAGQIVVDWAFREKCWVIPQQVGGDTSGVQIPFQILNCGSRVECTGSCTSGVWTFEPKS